MTATLNTDEIAAAMSITKGWHSDPYGQHRLRYRDDTEWTEHVTHSGPTPCPGCGTN